MFRLTIWTVTSLTDEPIKLIDVNGRVHPLPGSSMVTMIGVGWGLYAGSLFLNFLYYKMHPSATDISRGALKKRIVEDTGPFLRGCVCQDEDGLFNDGCCCQAWRCYLCCFCGWGCCCSDLVKDWV